MDRTAASEFLTSCAALAARCPAMLSRFDRDTKAAFAATSCSTCAAPNAPAHAGMLVATLSLLGSEAPQGSPPSTNTQPTSFISCTSGIHACTDRRESQSRQDAGSDAQRPVGSGS